MTDTLYRQTAFEQMHITGPDASQYLHPELKDFMKNGKTIFKINNKFRSVIAAPQFTTTSDSQRLAQLLNPVEFSDNPNFVRTRFELSIPYNRIVDMGGTFFDVHGQLDRGRSFKPYGGTVYNPLAPHSSLCNYINPANTAFSILLNNRVGDINGDGVAQSVAVVVNGSQPSISGGFIGEGLDETQCCSSRAIRRQPNTDVNAYGAYVPPVAQSGSIAANTSRVLFRDDEAAAGVLSSAACAIDEIQGITYPDTRVVGITNDNRTIRYGNRMNCVAFRDNFINMMYYDSQNNGSFSSKHAGNNVINDSISDRNTELGYQYWIASLMSRYVDFDIFNQCVDSYDPRVRYFTNKGYDDSLPISVFAQAGRKEFKGATARNNAGAVIANSEGTIDYASCLVGEFNLAGSKFRNWIYNNLCEYLPFSYKRSVNVQNYPNAGNDITSYRYHNLMLPSHNSIDMFTEIGGRYSNDVMDTQNPFNHHKNFGLLKRSALLGNSRLSSFHIQVPNKFFGLKSLLLLPGIYNYEWNFRKDPNMVLQSTLGIDLRDDGASITYNHIKLYVPTFPFTPSVAGKLDMLLRQGQNDQVFFEPLGAKSQYVEIPANTVNVSIEIPSQTWHGFKGWRFGRIKRSEFCQKYQVYEPNLRYSGTYPHIDGNHYLTHSFRSLEITWDSSIQWPGMDRLFNPNYFEIKKLNDQHANGYWDGSTIAQSNMTKDFWLVQNSANYNQGYQGYKPVSNFFEYDFMRNFVPMSKQVNIYDNANTFDLENDPNQAGGEFWNHSQVRNNTGFVGDRTVPNSGELPQGAPYPSNWPYPSIGDVIDNYTSRKFLLDKYMYYIPFSSNFMNMGELTDLGQTSQYVQSASSMKMNFQVDPLPEPSIIQMLYGVFDCVKFSLPARNIISSLYFRTPFNATA